MNKLRVLFVSSIAALALATTGAALAAPDQEKKEFVCHFTASAKNPVVVINIGNAAVGHHESNHHPEVHQGSDSSSDGPPADCGTGGGGGEE